MIRLFTLSFSINQSTFIFMTQKERMRVAAKDQLVIESAAPYCSKLTSQKVPNETMKKKKKLHECSKLAQNMLFFYQTMDTNDFLQTIQYTEEKA